MLSLSLLNMTPKTISFLQAQWQTLGSEFYNIEHPQALGNPYWLAFNTELAQQLGLKSDIVLDKEALAILSGSLKKPQHMPISTVYSGHQFGVYVPQLGDGRAMLLGDIIDTEGVRQEIQLKGAGQTKYSRFADGRAVLRSSIREYLCSEAMHGLGIATTRALSLTGSNDAVHREVIETSAVVTRVAKSFMRFGHFEFGYHQSRTGWVQALADMAIQIDYPECKQADNPYLALFAAITTRSALLAAKWQSVGFCHGVLNTDNMSVLGLTIDYGPFGFLDAYDAHHICNHSDNSGRYAYNQQPYVVQWNLSCLASCFLELASEQDLVAILNGYADEYHAFYKEIFAKKLGLTQVMTEDKALLDDFFTILQHQKADFTLAFRNLSQLPSLANDLPACFLNLFQDTTAIDVWVKRYQLRLQAENSVDAERQISMNQVNPKYILRNYILENTISAAKEGNAAEIEKVRMIFQNPFDEQPEHESYAALPPDWASEICVSCSS